jgi:glutamate dehydrogenase
MEQRKFKKGKMGKTPSGAKKPRASASDSLPSELMEAFRTDAMVADLTLFPAGDREKMAKSLWSLAQKRQPHTLKLRLYNPKIATDGWTVDHTVLETVNDDMPFLVDSMTSALQRRNLAIHLVIHPIYHVVRDGQGKLKSLSHVKSEDTHAESFMHIQFDHCLDPALLADIEEEMQAVLKDVRAAVEDWPTMRKRMAETIAAASSSKLQESNVDNAKETKAFLRWLDDNNFTYLGVRDINLSEKNGELAGVKVMAKSGLGVLRDAEVRAFGGMRDLTVRRGNNLERYVRQHHLLVITKTNIISRVHRTVPMDAIFVRRFNDEGDVIGERLFVGLFTSQSYSQNPRDIPFLRRKIAFVVEKAGLAHSSHNGKALAHILDNYIHDELFQIDEDELLRNALGILQLQERARVALFVRYDPFERFVTCVIYAPRERYDSILRYKMRGFLEAAFGGKASDWQVRVDDSVLARVFLTISTASPTPRPDIAKLEASLREMARSWYDRLRDSLSATHGEGVALALLGRYGHAFSPAYRDNIPPHIAVCDIDALERMKDLPPGHLIVDLAQSAIDQVLHLKLFQARKPIALSEVLPMIEAMGLKIEYMGGPYEVSPKGEGMPVFIHEFVGRPAQLPITPFEESKAAFEEAFAKVWLGEAESDNFNALSLSAAMPWREVVILRAFARYLRQLRIPYSHEMIGSAFLHYPKIAQDMCALFLISFNPAFKGNRKTEIRKIEARINDELAKVDVLEEDRIIRRYLNLVQSALRTNYFQTAEKGEPKSYVSIKFDSRALDYMPLPKPLYEIFVYSPRTEAVHLRGGKVARGGIRWSDRRDDFRNEILGLMKAQMVKNSVIVPVGSKGGFIVKRPPVESDKFLAEGIACYRTMMCGLLDVTDNRVGGKIVTPKNVVRYDEDDPYLVVAADKGTAKFSDIANGISREYGFWLDDAFASGGSAGYDHKQMGITARGAWESVKRHFREIGKNIQTTPFTCIGVGDMSGDVFGNAMLLSKQTQLLGAFDHRHIFCDPNPDLAKSFAERERMFALPRSSWDDYDRKAISKGGGVFPRNAKSIKLTPEMKKAYGISAASLTPAELIQYMLKAEIELLYFGGIGTFVKAGTETQEEVSDRANEALRIDGREIRAKIVGEGANLGVTQRGRIEYALKGGRINTDAIDNSAGVDTSDHEVNIKILLRKAVDTKRLTLPNRNKLLSSMTDDVAYLVLRDNYYQTLALSIAEARAPALLQTHTRMMQILEKSGLLNRKVEYLPDEEEVAKRERMGKGLTRPEMAVLLSYAKLWLFQHVVDSDLPDDPYMQMELERYFPEPLRKKYINDMKQHQLRREIIATVVTNSLVNRLGIDFASVMAERWNKSPAAIARAYVVARKIFQLREEWRKVEALDNKAPAAKQSEMILDLTDTLVNAIGWLLKEGNLPKNLAAAEAAYKEGKPARRKLDEWLKHSVGKKAKQKG